MMPRAILALSNVIAMLSVLPALGQSRSHPVTAELIADVSGIEPGQTFHVGVLLTMRPHWHTYWVNPGDSGQTTDVSFKLPDGFVAGPLQFPTPISFTQPGDIAGYGYEEQVLLISQVQAPANLEPGMTVSLAASVRWLVCDDKTCIPGKADVELSLPVVESAEPANAELFETWRARLPKPASDVGAQVEWSQKGDLTSGEQATYTASVHWPRDVSDVDLFPTELPKVSIEQVTARHEGRTSQLSLTLRPLAGAAPQLGESVPAVIGYTTSDGHRRGIAVQIPVTSAGAARTD